MNKIIYFLSINMLLFQACNLTVAEKEGSDSGEGVVLSEAFKEYWYAGEAEIASYQLEQVRYGQIHDGHAVLIFVTEDFSRKKHVKLDNPSEAGNDAVNVMKLNFTKKFNTGIYPYSMMMSVFKPTDYIKDPSTLKVTASSQEWCGHTFTQVDLENNDYEGTLYSYFESEGSKVDIDLNAVLMEDEIWNQIRLNPEKLPTGQVKIIPGLLSQRLIHSDFEVKNAEASLEESNNGHHVYTLQYQQPERTLKIFFENEFPYQITGWEETRQSGFGPDAELLTTRATLEETLKTDYWNKNKKEDEVLRQELGLQ